MDTRTSRNEENRSRLAANSYALMTISEKLEFPEMTMTKSLKAFLSYSHCDEHALERFSKHLAMLKRDGSISEWFDQKILPGGDIDAEISKHLEECDLFIPLISADFLDSNYCYEREMTQALSRHEEGTMRVVPVIVAACEWKASPLANLKALPKDGKPVAEWTSENNAWLDVVSQLRRLVKELATSCQNERKEPAKSGNVPKYRLKRDFDELDKLEFREEAFAVIRNYFEQAAAEIREVEDIKSRFTPLGDNGFTCTVVNRACERGVAHITVYSNSGRSPLGDITYSFQERAEPNTANGWLQIEADEYELFLKWSDMVRSNNRSTLSPQQAAAQLWDEFLGKAGITHA